MKYADVLRNRYFQVITSVIVVVNVLLIFAVSQGRFAFSESPINSRIGILRKASRYNSITQIQSNNQSDNMWITLAKIKQGDLEVYKTMSGLSIEFRPQWWGELVKSSLLMSNKDFVGAQKVLDNVRVNDKGLASLVLALRGYQMCQQRLREDCKTLADSAISLDPVAPLGHYVLSWPLRVDRDYKGARDVLNRAMMLSGIESTWLYHNRGLTYFYTRDRELSAQDLMRASNDPDLGFEAKIFLGRNALEKKNYSGALEWFTAARAEKGTGNALPYLRLGRLAVTQENRGIAKILYNQGFELFPNNMEMITDYLTLSHKQNDSLTRADMLSAMSFAVGSNPYNHEIAGRKLREIGEFDLAKQYINRGLEYVKDVKDPIAQSKQTTGLYQQLFVSYAIDVVSGMRANQNIQPLFDAMSGLQVQQTQLIFLQGLNRLVTGDTTGAQMYFDQLTGAVKPSDYSAIVSWYYLLGGDTNNASRQGDFLNIDTDKLRKLTLEWAILEHLNRTSLANQRLEQIKQLGVIKQLTDETPDLKREVWSYMQLPFRPWLAWLAPYADPLGTVIIKD